MSNPEIARGGEKPFDLAVLCMTSDKFVRQHRSSGREARRMLIAHFKDFANQFLVRTLEALGKQGTASPDPEGTVCGPSTPAYTMPMPGEWMRFQAVP